jgi:hypothetical protein
MNRLGQAMISYLGHDNNLDILSLLQNSMGDMQAGEPAAEDDDGLGLVARWCTHCDGVGEAIRMCLWT